MKNHQNNQNQKPKNCDSKNCGKGCGKNSENRGYKPENGENE